MGWITNEFGTRIFTDPTAPGWELTVFESTPSVMHVDSPDDTEVSVTSGGIEVFGEESHGYAGFSGVRFTIPWVITREIIRFQESVQSSTSM